MFFILFLLSSFSQAGGHFLTISPGARQVAMGSAFTAIANDAVASFYNPGGLAFVENATAGFMNSCFLPGLRQIILKEQWGKNIVRGPNWLDGFYPDMRYMYFGGAVPLSEEDAFGWGYTYFVIGEDDVEPSEWNSFNFDCAVTVSYGREVYRNVGIGFSLKYIYTFLMPDWLYREYVGESGGTAATFAYDWGILYKTPLSGLSFGISAQNLGSRGLKYSKDGNSDPIPSLIRMGVAFNPMPLFESKFPRYVSGTIFSFDRIQDLVGEKHEIWWSMGSEIVVNEILSLRIGYFNDESGERKGITWGSGIRLSALQLDVASDEDIYDFATSNWRVQVSLKSNDFKKGKLYENRKINMLLAGLSSLVVPGGGQFYNEDGLKGIIYSTGAFALGELYYNNDNEAIPITLGILHFLSIFDAILGAR